MKLKEIMTDKPDTVSPQSTLSQAAERMNQLNVGALPVVENGQIVGIITDRDIVVRALARHQNPEQEQVRSVMSTNVHCCYDDDDVSAAVKLMEEKQIRRLPILTRSNRLAGIVSLGDFATESRDDRLAGEILAKVSETRAQRAVA